MLLLSYLTFLDLSAGNTKTEPSYFGDVYSYNHTPQLKSDKNRIRNKFLYFQLELIFSLAIYK